jgi:hypothetical protein
MEKQSGDKIDAFKRFVKAHPGMIKEVRNGDKTWQHFFEEWTILGEKDERWSKYKVNDINTEKNTKDKKNSVNVDQIFSMLKQVDLNQMQHYISQFSGAMATVQEVISIFQPNQGQKGQGPRQRQPQQQDYPYPFFRD